MLSQTLAYLFRIALRLFDYFKTRSWERTIAFVTGQIVVDPAWRFPSVKLHYRFDSNGSSTKGWDVLPFQFVTEAKEFAESFPHNHPVTIRVNQDNSQETRFFERDQKSMAVVDKKPTRKGPFPLWQVGGITLVLLWDLYCVSADQHAHCFPCQLLRVIAR